VHLRWAEILGRHAAKVFHIMSGLPPDRLEMTEADLEAGPRHPLGVRVDFTGLDELGRPLSGHFVCAFETAEAARDIASAIAVKMGLSPPDEGDLAGVDAVLGEFLNIVIGLTCSDWAELGLATEFDPPQPLAVHGRGRPDPGSRAFHLTMSAAGRPQVSIYLVFTSGPDL
jgi:CheY-specific phosphatase CheX